jgi:hypothetical protein|tara:strand:- start:1085 stop:1222 length:138 start_codon:yes stop_codon:yes gene_type:complete
VKIFTFFFKGISFRAMHTMANQDYLQDAPILFDKVYNLMMMKGSP